MDSPHAMLRLLRNKRREFDERIGDRELGAASLEVFDELIRRIRLTADRTDERASVTLLDLQRFPSFARDVQHAMETYNAMCDIVREAADVIGARRDPILRFVTRIEAEGYEVTNDFNVIDTHEWDISSDDPDLLVQLEVERIARAEQTIAYQERVTRMAASFDGTEAEYS